MVSIYVDTILLKTERMNKFFFYLVIMILLLLSGCRQEEKELAFTPPVFQHTRHLTGKVLIDTFVMGLCYDMDCYKDYLLVSAYRGDKELLNFFDKNSGKYLKSILSIGRGAGEALSLKDFNLDHATGKVIFYDLVANRLTNFIVDSVIAHEKPETYIHSRNYPIYMYNVLQGNNGYIAEGGYKENDKRLRLSIIENDSAIYKYYTFPNVKIPGTDAKGIEPAYTYGSRLTISPNKKQLAYSTNYGAILEIFDLTPKQITLNTIKGFYRPVYTLDKNNIQSIPGETVWGFIDLYATDKYIYTIFSGSTNPKDTKNIGVFDWKGNCLDLYTTDYQLEKICVDEPNRKIYANGLDANLETVIVTFDI